MATSGSYNYSLTADDIITAALEDIEVLQPGVTIATADYASVLRTLNMLAKQWMGTPDFAPGLKIFSRKRVSLFLEKGQHKYSIGPASGDARAAVTYGKTTLDAAEASSQTVLSVTATSDTTTFPGTTVTMTASDIIGIQLTSGEMHWDTVASIVAGDTVTVDTGLAGAASNGAVVYWFTARAQKIIDLEYVVLRNSNDQDTPIRVYKDLVEYESLPDKYGDGTPQALLFEPQLTNTDIYLDSQPTDLTERIILTGFYASEDYDSTTGADDIAYPAQWYGALEWGLAKRIAPKFEKPWTQDRQDNYSEAMSIARNFDPKMSRMFFEANRE